MAAGSPEGDAHMEELVDHGLGMEETDQGLLRRPSLRETYHSDSLLAPDVDFITGREESITKIGLPGKCSRQAICSLWCRRRFQYDQDDSISPCFDWWWKRILISKLCSSEAGQKHHTTHRIADWTSPTSHIVSHNGYKCLNVNYITWSGISWVTTCSLHLPAVWHIILPV